MAGDKEVDETEVPPEKEASSELEDGLRALGRVATGLAGKVLGERFAGSHPPDKPVVNEDFDEAVDTLSRSVGRVLHAAGESMKEAPDKPEVVVERTKARLDEGEEPVAEEGFSPLVEGARSFSEGLGKVASELLDGLAAKQERPKGEE